MATGGLDLGKQVGPLPLGMWIVVGAAGLGIGYMINKNANKAEPQGTFADPDSDVGTGGQQLIYDPPTNQPAPESGPADNAEWARRGTNIMIAKGGYNFYTVWNALQKYISGEKVTTQEMAIINIVIGELGAPPEPISPVDSPTTPTPTTGIGLTVTPSSASVKVGSSASFTVKLTKNGAPHSGSVRVRVGGPTSDALLPGVIVVNGTGKKSIRADATGSRTYTFQHENKSVSVKVTGIKATTNTPKPKPPTPTGTKYVTTITKRPAVKQRAGVPFNVQGRVTLNGKPFNGPLAVSRKGPGYPNYGVIQYVAVIAGRWSWTGTVGGRAGRTWTFRFSVGPGSSRESYPAGDQYDYIQIRT